MSVAFKKVRGGYAGMVRLQQLLTYRVADVVEERSALYNQLIVQRTKLLHRSRVATCRGAE